MTIQYQRLMVFLHFLSKCLKFNYQLLWEQQDQNAYIHFPQVLTEVELLPHIISGTIDIHITETLPHLDKLINFDNQFLIYNSEISESRRYTTTNITPQTLSEQYDFSNLQQDSQQDIFYSDDNLDELQNQEEQFPYVQDTQQNMTLPPHIPDPSTLLQYQTFPKTLILL